MIPLFTSKQVRDVDKIAIEKFNFPDILLMENAAFNIHNSIIEEFNPQPNQIIGIVCGKGNNGGDGLAVARHFLINGFQIKVLMIYNIEECTEDAKTNFLILSNLGKTSNAFSIKNYKSLKDINFLTDCEFIIDAILGSGTQGSIIEPIKSIVNKLNSLNCKKIAIDNPTGLNIDTGFGETIFKADLTISLSNFKKGLFFNDGYLNSGKVKKGSIGIDEKLFDNFAPNTFLIELEDAFFSLPKKSKGINKYSAGKVLSIAGSGQFPGAAVLSSVSALKVGAGASILCFPDSIKNLVHSKYPELVVQHYQDNGQEYFSVKNLEELNDRLLWADVISLGPGIGRNEETINGIISIIKKYKNKIKVIDADAIFAIGNYGYKNLDLSNSVLTPHIGEFSKLINVDLKELNKNILFYGEEFVKEKNCYLVLKGPRTIIFTKEEEIFINSVGNEGLAKFGTGDVLTGVIAGFLSQTKSFEDSLISGVYLHSFAADLLKEEKTEFGYTSTDLLEKLPFAIKFIKNSIV